MQKIKNFITQSIENYLLNIDSQNYYKLEHILQREELVKLSFYLESNQEKEYDKLLIKLLDKETQKKLEEILSQEPKQGIVAKGLNPEGETYTIFYGTNREPSDPTDISLGYGNERTQKLNLGSCTVHVPKSHNIGGTKGSLWHKIRHLDASYGDVALKKLYPLDADEFWSKISTLLAPLKAKEQEALVFIHGFNTSFEDAAIRATQISVDLGHLGITAFFSWASKGKALSYLSDEATAQFSEKHLTDFLTDFAQKSGAKRIHIIAHSMGNRILLEAINRIYKENLKNPKVEFGQIILAAPDVDADVFEELSVAYTKLSEQTTLYVSGKDKAVGMSKWLHSHNRAGFTPPVCVVKKINTIVIESSVNILELGHGYFARHNTLLKDIKNLIDYKLDANNRENLILQKVSDKNKYWKLKSSD